MVVYLAMVGVHAIMLDFFLLPNADDPVPRWFPRVPQNTEARYYGEASAMQCRETG